MNSLAKNGDFENWTWFANNGDFETKLDFKNNMIFYDIPIIFPWYSHCIPMDFLSPGFGGWIAMDFRARRGAGCGDARDPGSGDTMGYHVILGNLHVILVHILTKKVWISIRTYGKWLNKHE